MVLFYNVNKKAKLLFYLAICHRIQFIQTQLSNLIKNNEYQLPQIHGFDNNLEDSTYDMKNEG